MGKKVIKRRIIISYICIGTIFLGLFAGIVANTLLSNGKREVTEYLAKNNENIYESANILLDTVFISMHDFYSHDTTVINALYSDKLDSFEKSDIHNTLKRMVYSSPIIESIYIYNQQQDMYYSSVATPKNHAEFYEKDLMSDLYELQSSEAIFAVREISMDEITLNYDPNVITFLFNNSSYETINSSKMIVNISREKLNKIIYSDTLSMSSMISFVVDEQGKLLTYSNEVLDISEEEQQLIIDKIHSDGYVQSNFNRVINGEESIVSYVYSNKWKCTFISVASYEVLLSEVTEMIKAIILLTGIFITISTISALYFTKIIYNPIGELVQRVSGLNNLLTNNHSNEYDYVLHAIENMKDEIGNLEDEVSSFQPDKKNNLLKHLLSGNTITEEALSENFIRLRSESYAVMVLRIDSFNALSQSKDMKEMIIYRNGLIKLVNSIVSEGFVLESVEDGLEYIPIILNIPNDQIHWLIELKRLMETVQKAFTKSCDLTFTTGIGNIVFDIKQLQDSFLDAREVTNYRIIYGDNAIITNQDFREAKLMDYVYPIQIEKKILDALKLSKRECLKKLILEFTESVKVFEYNEMLLSYSQLALVIVRTAKQINYKTNKDLRINYIEMQNRLNKCTTLNQINEVIYELLLEIIQRHEIDHKSKNGEVIERIKTYIQANYNDTELSVEMIAESESFSVNYLRNVFKNDVGVSLSDYINQVRYDKAKSLLVETKYSAKKIALMCGFHSTDYFYYAFKKFTGMSPTNYRKENVVLQ